MDFEAKWRPHILTAHKERELCLSLDDQLEELEGILLEGQVAARVLEFFALHVACDDLGNQVESLMLPLIRERLVAGARQYAADQAERAQQEILAMEEVRDLFAGMHPADTVILCNGNDKAWYLSAAGGYP